MKTEHFEQLAKNVIGHNQTFETPFGVKKLIYADWTASGRLYRPIELKMTNMIGAYIGNTHTETSLTGAAMTMAYHEAKNIIKSHVNAAKTDVLICAESGMTGVINKFQRILGLKIHEKYRDSISINDDDKPVIFITSMEHHSNQTSWLETIADVELIGLGKDGNTDMSHLRKLLKIFDKRKMKIAAITSCSNVTGIITNYKEIASLMHENNGYCFVDFAASAPYISIDMHPENEKEYLDAIFFSPHKFLGGPGTSGVLIFNSKLYTNNIPDNPGGGTVEWTNPWGQHKFVDDIEAREDGGTPPFLQTIRIALAINLKEQMGIENMAVREKEINAIVWNELEGIDNLRILASECKERLPIFSFYIIGLHYNLAVRILNDRFGIQTRGGCSCAGTYGHILLNVDIDVSKMITEKINLGDQSDKPGWIRASFHPIMTDDEVLFVTNSIKELAENFDEWSKDYLYNNKTNTFYHKEELEIERNLVKSWFAKGI